MMVIYIKYYVVIQTFYVTVYSKVTVQCTINFEIQTQL